MQHLPSKGCLLQAGWGRVVGGGQACWGPSWCPHRRRPKVPGEASALETLVFAGWPCPRLTKCPCHAPRALGSPGPRLQLSAVEQPGQGEHPGHCAYSSLCLRRRVLLGLLRATSFPQRVWLPDRCPSSNRHSHWAGTVTYDPSDQLPHSPPPGLGHGCVDGRMKIAKLC